MSYNNKSDLNWVLVIITSVFSIYCFIIFVINSGFFPKCPLTGCSWVFLLLSFIFAITPFFSKIKFGKIFELQREFDKTKNELKEFKELTLQQFSLITSNVSTISNLQNTININIPGILELHKAKTELDEKTDDKIKEDANEIRDTLVFEDEDIMVALVKTRIRMEGILRKILGKQKYAKIREGKPVKYLGLYSLFMMFINSNKSYSNLKEPFKYVNQIYNAAAHAQIVSIDQANEALEIGTRLIAILQDYLDKNKVT